MQTASGGKFFFLDPRLEEIKIGDIAHHLSMQCRFAGACRRFYSVAEHSVKVCEVVWNGTKSPRMALSALLHDAHEAYVQDVTRPLKLAMRRLTDFGEEPHTFLSRKIQEAINRKFGCLPGKDPLIDLADVAVLFAEARALLLEDPWHLECSPEVEAIAREVVIERSLASMEAPHFAALAFLRRFDALSVEMEE